ncbi:MAG: glycosyltransferase family 2 protein [Elusimicrobia bacterium]|nr:glycosyltransferase family 2 protein [Elusimicrobiota bacterium]
MHIPFPWNLPVTLAANALEFFLLGTWFFYLVLSLRGFFKRSARKSDPAPLRRFAVLVPAYNEENVIGLVLESLRKMSYPAELFDIYMVADHCTDNTAGIARAAGARVIEYGGDLPAGKGYAICRATNEILALGRYDALCYFDADSLAHPDFLTGMSAHLNRGETAIQGNEIPKNPHHNWLTRTLFVSQVIFNNFYQYPKHFFGFSATLHGKGMCFTPELMRKFPWDGDCLTEDIEMQMRLVRAGVRVYFAPDAIVYDEVPADLREHFHRSVRWAVGALETARRHTAGLWLRAARKLDYRAFETALRLTQTYRFMLAACMTALLFANQGHFNLLVWIFNHPHGARLTIKLLNWLPLGLYPTAALLIDGTSLTYAVYYLVMILMSIVLVIPIYIGALQLKRRRRWHRTAHTSLTAIHEIVGERP